MSSTPPTRSPTPAPSLSSSGADSQDITELAGSDASIELGNAVEDMCYGMLLFLLQDLVDH
jgi:hypothetical protein